VKAYQALRGSVVTVVAAAVLAVAGCATADTAAVVNGDRITEQQAQEAARQIRAAQPSSGLDTPNAVASLVMAAFINDIAVKTGKGLSDSAARAAVAGIADPAPATLELVKASLSWNQMTSDEQGQAVELARKADITINPRYGTFDPTKVSFAASNPNWIKTQPTTPAPQG
jgi:parvulin-like peptidyl-prolyl isomerase